MYKNIFWAIFLPVVVLGFAKSVTAHSGRTDSSGCHNNSQTGSYHCHGRSSSSSPGRLSQYRSSSYTGNCQYDFQTAADGSRCGKRSAASRPGGWEPSSRNNRLSDPIETATSSSTHQIQIRPITSTPSVGLLRHSALRESSPQITAPLLRTVESSAMRQMIRKNVCSGYMSLAEVQTIYPDANDSDIKDICSLQE